MSLRLLILAATLSLAATIPASAQGTAACETAFRRCVAECPPGAAGNCTNACYGERAMCIQNPSRARQSTPAPSR